MKRIAFLLVFLTLFGMQASARAEAGPGLLQRIAAIDGATTAFVQRGDILYAATGLKVSVYDVSDPAQPRHLADSPLMSETARNLAVAGDLLFVTDDIDGLWIFRILPDHQLQVEQHLFTNVIVRHVVSNGAHIFVTGWSQSHAVLSALEIRNHRARIIGQIEIHPGTMALDVEDNILYLINFNNLYTYDVSDPQNMHQLGRYQQPQVDYFLDVEAENGIAYVLGADNSGNTDSTLIVVDVREPAAPKKLSLEPLLFSASVLSLAGKTLYLGGDWPGIHIYDVSTPASPQPTGTYTVPVAILLATPKYLFTSGEMDDILISDISAPNSPQLVGRIRKMKEITKISVQQNKLYMTDARGGFFIFDISDVQRPRLLGQNQAGDGAVIEDFVVADNIVYQAFRRYDSATMHTSYALRVLDITDPAAPTEIGRYPLTTDPHHLAYAAPYIYLATDIHLVIFDVSHPAQPDLLSFVVSSYTLQDMLTEASTLYTTIKHVGLKIWDVTDPYLPEHAAFLDTPGRSAWELERHGEQIIIADGRGGLAFVDVSQVDKPVLQTAIDCDYSAQNVAVAGDMLFAVCHDLGWQQSLHAYDLTDPTHPRPEATMILSRNDYTPYHPRTNALVASGDLIFFNAGDAGLQVFHYLPPAQARHLWLPSVHLPASSPFFSPAPTPTPATPSSRP